jgi:hypothetical protein
MISPLPSELASREDADCLMKHEAKFVASLCCSNEAERYHEGE